MNARRYVVPAALRPAMFVPGQAPGRREPARVSAAAFPAAGLPVPAHAAQRYPSDYIATRHGSSESRTRSSAADRAV